MVKTTKEELSERLKKFVAMMGGTQRTVAPKMDMYVQALNQQITSGSMKLRTFIDMLNVMDAEMVLIKDGIIIDSAYERMFPPCVKMVGGETISTLKMTAICGSATKELYTGTRGYVGAWTEGEKMKLREMSTEEAKEFADAIYKENNPCGCGCGTCSCNGNGENKG